MSKTWYGHHIDTIKGNDYVLFKDYLELDKTIEEKDKEITRLNNIIYELEKWLEEFANLEPKYEYEIAYCNAYKCCLDKLKELKEGKYD